MCRGELRTYGGSVTIARAVLSVMSCGWYQEDGTLEVVVSKRC